MVDGPLVGLSWLLVPTVQLPLLHPSQRDAPVEHGQHRQRLPGYRGPPGEPSGHVPVGMVYRPFWFLQAHPHRILDYGHYRFSDSLIDQGGEATLFNSWRVRRLPILLEDRGWRSVISVGERR